MNKFWKLCSCEFIKIINKKSIKIFIAILLLSTFLVAGLTWAINKLDNKMYSDTYEGESALVNMRDELNSYKNELSDNENVYDEITKNELKAKIEYYELALSNNIIIKQVYWKSDILANDINDILVNKYNAISMKDSEAEAKFQEEIDRFIELLKKDNFEEYIKVSKEKVNIDYLNGMLDKEEYEDAIYILDLKMKYNIGKSFDKSEVWKSDILAEIKTIKESLRTGLNLFTTGKSLSEEDIEKYNDNIKINEYRLEKNIKPLTTNNSLPSNRKMYDSLIESISFFLLAIMVIIIAGSSISNEISKGTIKFWSFLPVKRWKILLSKLVVNTLVLLVLTIVLTIMSTLIGNLFFGAANAESYLYVRGGNVHVLSYFVYILLYYLINAFQIWIFIVLAMMISTVTRNSAAGIGISLTAYLSGSSLFSVINVFVKADWLKFNPFNNFNLTTRIFANNYTQSMTTVLGSITGNISVGFSIGLLAVCTVIMMTTMFDNFVKKDLK